ncbi:hypothetical protein WJX72_004126 [[Myrmecia] bisecta]|uniref:Matrin-type domain-containing protein n=1 Tax=[Myrmecia] bisecta TaxID=41462 RepID=A0AAW1PZY4_9CHLO
MAMPAAAESPEPASAEQPSPEQQHNQRANGVHAGFERNIGASADLAKQSGPASGSTGQALRPLSAVSPVRVTRHTMVREAVVAKGLAVEEGQSREVTQFHCDACDIFTTCQELLESHYRGRKHIKRMAALAAAEQGLGPMPETLPRQPQAETPFYCELCNVYATGEDQLAMHFEGKKHQRHVSLREVQQGGAVLLPRGTSAASSSSGGAAAPPKSLSGMELRCELCDIVAPSPQHFEFHIRGQKHLRKEKQRRQMAEQQLQEAEQAQLAGSPRAVPAEPLSQASDSAVEQEPNPFSNTAAEAPDAAVQPSLEQAAERAVGKEVGLAASAPAQPQLRRVLSGKPPLPPSRSSLELQGPRSSKSNVLSVSSASDAAGKGDDGAEASVSDSSAVPGLIPEEGAEASSSLESDAGLSRTLSSIPPLQASGGSVSIAGLHFCPVCGIIATSEANLQDHIGGRRHARRLQYISQQGNWGDGSRNSTSSGELQFTLTRQPSGNIYDNFPCVRVGDYNLPSSMDLRHYLEEVQEAGRQGSGSSLEGSQSENSTPSSTPKAYASSASSHLTARDAFRCELCNVTATSQANLHAHFEGSLHKKRMQQQPSRTPSGSLGVPPPRPPAEPYPHHMLLHPQQRHHQQQALLQEHHEQQRMHGMGVGQSMHSVHSAAALYGSPSPHPMVHMGLASQSPPPLPSAVDMYMAHFYPPQYYHMAPHGQPGMAAYMAPTGWWGGAPPPQPGHVVGLPYRTPMQPFDANAMSMNAPLPHKRI